jgi:putative transposase
VLTGRLLDLLYETLRRLAVEVKCRVTDVKGEGDHVHLILETPPTVCLSAVIGRLKSCSVSVLLNEHGSFFWGRNKRTLWSSGYFVCSTGGVTLEVLKRYVEGQRHAANPP